MPQKDSAEKAVRDTRRKTRQKFSSRTKAPSPLSDVIRKNGGGGGNREPATLALRIADELSSSAREPATV